MESLFSNLSNTIPAITWFTPWTNLSLPNTTGIWPWTGLSFHQWSSIIYHLQFCYEMLYKVVNTNILITFVIGTVGSLLIGFTVTNMPKQCRTAFYYVMCVIGILDGIFVVFKFLRYIIQSYDVGPAALQFYGYASGIAYTCSLSSDLITLALTVERFIALGYPVFYQGLTPGRKRQTWLLGIVISHIVGITRMHYIFDTFDYPGTIKDEVWFQGIVFFSDTVIPFALTGVMLTLVPAISAVVYKRQKQKRVQIAQKSDMYNQKNKGINEALKTVTLLFVLMLMFFLNQVGYILYTVAELIYFKQTLTYSSSLADIQHLINVSYFYLVISGMSSVLEAISRSLPFFLYVAFCGSFRQEFMNGIRKLASVIPHYGASIPNPTNLVRPFTLRSQGSVSGSGVRRTQGTS